MYTSCMHGRDPGKLGNVPMAEAIIVLNSIFSSRPTLWGWGRPREVSRKRTGTEGGGQTDVLLSLQTLESFPLSGPAGRHPHKRRFPLYAQMPLTKTAASTQFSELYLCQVCLINSQLKIICQRGIPWGGKICSPSLTSVPRGSLKVK